MKRSTLILSVVAIGCGLGAAYLTGSLLDEWGRNNQPNPPEIVIISGGFREAPMKKPTAQYIMSFRVGDQQWKEVIEIDGNGSPVSSTKCREEVHPKCSGKS